MARIRADLALAASGLVASREAARAAILAGTVRIAGEPVAKAGQLVDEGTVFTVDEGPRFVSRGGRKLEGALDAFGVDVTGLRVVDVGASTGGFTDCALQRGAASVAAVDVGYGQLAWSLRNDPRVSVFERTNVRHASVDDLGGPFDLAVVDVSFIALSKVLPKLGELVAADGAIVALVKPQFEAGKGRVGKKGVVRDPAVHVDVLAAVVDAAREAGWSVRGLTWSPIKGPEGNIEFWAWLDRVGPDTDVDVEALVAAAHEQLGGAGAGPHSP
jgi:23S rRNA (cytidine1920-2'-O)/16S rRNA (cytidine1409-2'-O)-methyltransferase